MEFGWLQQGASSLIVAMAFWLGNPETSTLTAIVAGTTVLVLAGAAAVLRKRRRAASKQSQKQRSEAEALRGELRQRLAETGSLLADGISGAPTMGASEAFEGDIAAAWRTVLPEAGWQRAKAKELLRQRVNGHDSESAELNGSEALYWRQLGALSLLDSTDDALAAYTRAADL